MYTLYSWRNSYSMTAQVGLEELGLDYELIWTTIHIPHGEKDPAFVAANPNGRVPTLLTPDGPLYETAAILVYPGPCPRIAHGLHRPGKREC